MFYTDASYAGGLVLSTGFARNVSACGSHKTSEQAETTQFV